MRGRDNDVIAGLAGQQLGLQRVVAVVDVIADLDAGFLLETRDRVRRRVFGPVVTLTTLFCATAGVAAAATSIAPSAQRIPAPSFIYEPLPYACISGVPKGAMIKLLTRTSPTLGAFAANRGRSPRLRPSAPDGRPSPASRLDAHAPRRPVAVAQLEPKAFAGVPATLFSERRSRSRLPWRWRSDSRPWMPRSKSMSQTRPSPPIRMLNAFRSACQTPARCMRTMAAATGSQSGSASIWASGFTPGMRSTRMAAR